MKTLVSFATKSYAKALDFLIKTSNKTTQFDAILSGSPEQIDPSFAEKYYPILSASRGAGYWLWKPYFILQALESAQDGELILYADCASYFVNNAEALLDLPEKFNQDIIPFELEQIEGAWTKRDCFILLDVDSRGFDLSKQRQASFIVFRKSAFSLHFAQEYLRYCTNPNILTEAPNICGHPNYLGFIEHRYDQSIFSLLTKKYGLTAFRDPSQWGNSQKQNFSNSNYGQIFQLTRQASPKQAKFFYRVRKRLLGD
jgi:hypothetical protein